jgi:hypothetical protein
MFDWHLIISACERARRSGRQQQANDDRDDAE